MTDNNNNNDLLDDTLVKEYLLDHPEFFANNPELLTRLRFSHEHKGTISLVERQQMALRERLSALEEEITRLMANAKENERIFNAYGQMYIRLFACTEHAQLAQTLEQVATEELGLQSVSLMLFDVNPADAQFQRREEFKGLINRRLDKNAHYLGRLSELECKQLFNDTRIGSAALLALGDDAELGVLAFASRDAAHFDPDMDTLLISQLRNLLCHMIRYLNRNDDENSQSA